MRSDPQPVSRAKRIFQLVLCILGVLAGIPVGFDHSPSDLPFVLYLGGISITCICLLPRSWRRVFAPDVEPRPTAHPKLWNGLCQLCQCLAVMAIVNALIFFVARPQHDPLHLASTFGYAGVLLGLWSVELRKLARRQLDDDVVA